MTTLALKALQWKHSTAKPLTLTLPPGACVGILGMNGVGKTSLLHTLAGLLPQKHGQIHVDGRDVHALTPTERALKLGLLFQQTESWLPETVHEHCLTSRYPHGRSPNDHRYIENTLRSLQLLPLQHRRLTELSGGERRRVAIAALLVQAPTIFLLDEPSTHLDLAHLHGVLTHLRELTLTERHTVIATLHDPHHAAQYCSHVLLLFRDGSHQYGDPRTVLTEETISSLYGCSLDLHTRAFWSAHPKYGINSQHF